MALSTGLPLRPPDRLPAAPAGVSVPQRAFSFVNHLFTQIALVVAASLVDLWGTLVASPDLRLESNRLMKMWGWPGMLAINAVAVVIMASTWDLAVGFAPIKCLFGIGNLIIAISLRRPLAKASMVVATIVFSAVIWVPLHINATPETAVFLCASVAAFGLFWVPLTPRKK